MADLFEVPTAEPTRLVAGDLWTWARDDLAASYDPALHALSYTLAPETGGPALAITADAAAGRFLVEVAPATTATVAPGDKVLAGFLTRTADGRRVTLATLRVRVEPDPATSTADRRSEARRILDAINARLEGRATKDVDSYTIEGRSLARTPLPDLLRLRRLYEATVAREEGRSLVSYRRVKLT